jgi:hypothetical protein
MRGRGWRNVRGARRGSVYLIVLSVMSIGFLAVTAGILATRVHGSRAETLAEARTARQQATGGLEAGLSLLRYDTSWRRTFAGTLVQIEGSLGKTTVTAVDSLDGVVQGSESDPFRVTATAQHGGARRIMSVLATPNLISSDLLGFSIVANGAITLSSSTAWIKQPAHTNGTITLTSSTVEGTFTSSGVAQGAANYRAAVTLPVIADVIAAYEAIGSTGTMSGSGTTTLNGTFVGPLNPPWLLSSNSAGVYVIDCQGRRLTISDCRINGTFILKNATAGVRVTSSVIWDPVTAGYPALIVEGALSITMDGADLSEATITKSLNPATMPFEGSADSDTIDRYPSEFRGLIFASGNMTISGSLATTAPIFTNGTITTSSLTAVSRAVKPVNGPPGFRGLPRFFVDRESLARTVD